MTTPTKPVVEQVDREAAAALLVLKYLADGTGEKLALGLTNPVCDGLADQCDEVQAFTAHRLQSEAPLRAEIARLREEKIALLHDLAGCPCQRPPGAKGMPLGCCPPCRARRALGDSHVEG